MKDRLKKYLLSDKHLWWTITVLPGVYAIVYLYLNNYTLLNSWEQFSGFLLRFIALPVIELFILDIIFKKWLPKRRAQLYWSYFLINFSIIFSLAIYLGWRWKALLLFAGVTILLSFIIAKHYKKLVVLLGIMCLLAIGQFGFYYLNSVVPNKNWVEKQNFESYEFTNKPNIYIIQPDGFVGKPAATSNIYGLDNSSFYKSLEDLGFHFNHEFKSNYSTTLSSNSALFTAQHHYLGKNSSSELINAREIILGRNPVLRTLKNNGYETNLILEHSYLMLNYPDIYYDKNNVDVSELSTFLPKYYLGKDYQVDFKAQVAKSLKKEQPQFFFVEMLHPSHISFMKYGDNPIEREREKYMVEVKEVTVILEEMSKFILSKDPQAIIIIAADHGGFVGFTHTGESATRLITSETLKQSMFSSLLTIKAPDDFEPYRKDMKSTVSIFPMLFEYLAAKPIRKEYDFDNSSYFYVRAKDTKGLYRYFNTEGTSVEERVIRED